MFRFFTALVILLLIIAACSRTGSPLLPESVDQMPEMQSPSPTADGTDQNSKFSGGDSNVWGMVDITWDPSTGDVLTDSRSADIAIRHFKVSYFLTPPWCDDCITVENMGADPILGTGEVRITLRNPTQLWAYDVRGMLRIGDGVNLRLLNVDGYTDLFPVSGYQCPAPFLTYSESLPQHEFAPSEILSRTFELKTTPGADPLSFTLLVTAGHPSPAGDVSTISSFRQSGQLISAGGTATISFIIEDLQNDINGVQVDGGPLGFGNLWLQPSEGRWEGILQNASAAPGIYDLLVQAHSPNYQNAVTSNIYRAVVFADFTSWRTQLLNEVNADRASYSVGALSSDPCLNTVAQFHAQNMADLRFFSHYNLDGWSPWDRMSYYGVTYYTAGENIAVGQDLPQEVENAWMNSSGHKANILNSSFQRIGLGIVQCQPGDMYSPGYYWVQVFTN
jgi:uncharacterized protein YkwD